MDHYNNYIVRVPTPGNSAYNAVNSINHHWISKIGLIIWLQMEELSISILKWKIAVLCSILDTLQKLHRLLGQMDLLKCKIEILERICSYMIRLENWSIQVQFFAYANTNQPMSHLQKWVSEIVFQPQPPVPLNSQLNLFRNKNVIVLLNTALTCHRIPTTNSRSSWYISVLP